MPARLNLLSGGDSGESQAEATELVCRQIHVAGRRTTAVGRDAPTATSDYVPPAIVGVLTPLLHIAVPVVYTQAIGRVRVALADLHRLRVFLRLAEFTMADRLQEFLRLFVTAVVDQFA